MSIKIGSQGLWIEPTDEEKDEILNRLVIKTGRTLEECSTFGRLCFWREFKMETSLEMMNLTDIWMIQRKEEAKVKWLIKWRII